MENERSVMTLARMQEIQKELQEKYKDYWRQVAPENGHFSLLWAVGEMGEVIDIIKKMGYDAIMDDPDTRREFIREMVDVLMYMTDTMLCYGITPEEMTEVYEEKHAYNMHRWE